MNIETVEFRGGIYGVSDELLGTISPIVVYWVYSGLYCMLGGMENYRLHTKKDEDEKNLVTKKEVVKGVLLQQAVQAVVATILFAFGVSNVQLYFMVRSYTVAVVGWKDLEEAVTTMNSYFFGIWHLEAYIVGFFSII